MRNYAFIDLTHELHETIPVWPGATRFSRELQSDHSDLCRVYDYHQAEGIGTHVDAPLHWIPGGRSITDFKLEELIRSACVLNVMEQANLDPDHQITPQELLQWEEQHGEIPKQAIVLACTGWSERWHDEVQYRIADP